MKWQEVNKNLALAGTSLGVFVILIAIVSLTGVDYTYSGDTHCKENCESYINITSKYWRICFDITDEDKFVPELYKKRSRSRTLWLKMNRKMLIQTNPKIETELLVPTYGGKWRQIKTGDCIERGKINKFKVVGHKKWWQTVKWGLEWNHLFSEDISIDPLWGSISGDCDSTCTLETDYYNMTLVEGTITDFYYNRLETNRDWVEEGIGTGNALGQVFSGDWQMTPTNTSTNCDVTEHSGYIFVNCSNEQATNNWTFYDSYIKLETSCVGAYRSYYYLDAFNEGGHAFWNGSTNQTGSIGSWGDWDSVNGIASFSTNASLTTNFFVLTFDENVVTDFDQRIDASYDWSAIAIARGSDIPANTKLTVYIKILERNESASGDDKYLSVMNAFKNNVLEGDEPSTYYFANGGDDTNDCSSPSKACKTIAHLNTLDLIPGSIILFKRNDTWREPSDAYLSLTSGENGREMVYGSYGNGRKPIFYGSYNASSSSNWTNIYGNIWRTTFTSDKDIGNLIFNYGSSVGIKKNASEQLSSQGEFYYNFTDDKVYLYSSSDPSTYYSSIECAKRTHIISWDNKEYVRLENLSLFYGGAHGMGGSNTKHITVRNCTFRYIGGGYLDSTGSSTTRYGNCIEFFANTSDNVVEYNNISQCYDAGLTNQQSTSKVGIQYNITYRYNTISNTRFCYEFFNSNTQSDTDNITFVWNTCYNSGFSFGNQTYGYSAGRDLRLARDTPSSSGWNISNNIFYGSNGYGLDLGQGSSALWKGELPYLDYNLWYTNSTDYLIYWNGTGYYNLSDFRSAENKELNGNEGNPFFVNAQNFDFEPQHKTACSMSISGSYVGAVPCSCTMAYEDISVSTDTILCKGTYNLNDSGGNGVIRFGAGNIYLDCNGAVLKGANLASSRGIYTNGQTGVTIKNCNIYNYSRGISLPGWNYNNNISNNNIINVTLYGIESSSWKNGITNITVSDNNITCNVHSTAGKGIYVHDGDLAKIKDNILRNCTVGIWNSNTGNVTISSNLINLTDRGIFVELSDDVMIEDNIVNNTVLGVDDFTYGIGIEYNNTNVTVDNNTIRYGTVGVFFRDTNITRIYNNTFIELTPDEKLSFDSKYPLYADKGEMPTAIMGALLYKTFLGDGTEGNAGSPPSDYIDGYNSSNVSVLDNSFDSTVQVYMRMQGVINITTDLNKNILYRKSRFPHYLMGLAEEVWLKDASNITGIFTNNKVNVFYQGWRGSTTHPFINYSYHPTYSWYKNVNDSSQNITIYETPSTRFKIFNETSGQNITGWMLSTVTFLAEPNGIFNVTYLAGGCDENSDCAGDGFCNVTGFCQSFLSDGETCVNVTYVDSSSEEDGACGSGYCDNDGYAGEDDNWCFTPLNFYYDGQESNDIVKYCEYSANSSVSNWTEEKAVGSSLGFCFGKTYYIEKVGILCNFTDDETSFNCSGINCSCQQQQCDGLTNGTNIVNCSAGYTYFADMCNSTADSTDRTDNVCRNASFHSTCTADDECNGIVAGTGACNSTCGYDPHPGINYSFGEGITSLVFRPQNTTSKNVPPTGQNDTVSAYIICNNGTSASIDGIEAKLNTTIHVNMSLFITNNSDPSLFVVNLTTSYKFVNGSHSVPNGSCEKFWLWLNLSGTVTTSYYDILWRLT